MICCSCNSGDEKAKESVVDYCEGKSCFKCGDDAEEWCMGGVYIDEKNTPSNRYEKVGGIYRIFYCKKCWGKMPVANPFELGN